MLDKGQLELALSSAGMGAWEWTIETDVLLWDERMHALFGIDAGSFGGNRESFFALVHSEDRRRVLRGFTDARKKGVEYDGEFRTAWPSDGSMHLIRLRSRVHKDGQGKPARIIGVAWDITQRRQTEEALARERSLLATLMDNIPDNIYYKDTESRIITVNRFGAKWYGFDDPSEVIGKTDFDLFSREHAQAALEDERKIMRTGQPMVNVEEKETWPDGHETWVSTTKMPLRDEQGKIIGTFGLSRDITERKRAEAQLAKFAEELRIKNETLEQDLDMARELQNAMLPQHYPEFLHTASSADSAVHFYHFYQPSMAVSGDFFDVVKISDDVAGLFICDVMGHGVRAALIAATVRALIGELRYTWRDPAEFLSQLNRALCATLKQSELPLFASAFYVVADLGRGELRYANAGHPHPLRVHHAPDSPQPLPLNGAKPGPALGLVADASYENCRAPLSPHDVVLVFTDGLFEVESADGRLYDYPQLLKAVYNRSEMKTVDLCRGVIEEVQQFAANREFTDDVCLVAMEIDRLANGRT